MMDEDFKETYDTKLAEIEAAAARDDHRHGRELVRLGLAAMACMAAGAALLTQRWGFGPSYGLAMWFGIFQWRFWGELRDFRDQRRARRRIIAHLHQSRGWIFTATTWVGHEITGTAIDQDARGVLVSACDFCTGVGLSWVYPARSFLIEGLDFGPGQSFQSEGDWGACDACHDDWEHHRWDAIVTRYMTVRPRGGDPVGVAAALFPLWSQFRRARTGPAYPVGQS